MKPVVADASVLLKWIFVKEENSSQALAIRAAALEGALEVHVPALFFYEAGNLLCRLLGENAGQALRAFEEFGFIVHPPSAMLLATAVTLVETNGGTFYDVSYHALAIVLGGVYVTADRHYIRRAHDDQHVAGLAHWQFRP